MSTGTNVTNPAPTSLKHAQEVIREAQHQLNQLLRQRVTIMRRIGTVKQTAAPPLELRARSGATQTDRQKEPRASRTV